MTDKTRYEPLRVTTVAFYGPTGPAAKKPAARAKAGATFATQNETRFFELGFLAERGCLSEKPPPRKIA